MNRRPWSPSAISPADRAELLRIVSERKLHRQGLRQARLLLTAAAMRRPLQIDRLALAVGANLRFARKVLREGAETVQELLATAAARRPPDRAWISEPPTMRLSKKSRAMLEQSAKDPTTRAFHVKLIRLYLMATAKPGPPKIKRLARSAGVSKDMAALVLRNGESWLQTLLARTAARRAAAREPIRTPRRPLLPPLPLSTKSRAALERMVNDRATKPYRKKRARVLLAAAAQGPHRVSEIAKTAGVSPGTVSSALKAGVGWLKTLSVRDAARRRGLALKSHLPVPRFSRGIRNALERLAEDTVLQPRRATHARVLLLASGCTFPLPVDRLTRETGVSYPTLGNLLRDPRRTWQRLLKHDKEIPVPALSAGDRALLKRIASQPDQNPLRVKRAQALLIAAGRRGRIHSESLARAAGVSGFIAKHVINDPKRALREVLMPELLARKLSQGAKSLAEMRPDLVRQWHRSRNGLRTPENTSWKSIEKVWWRCSRRPTHVWQSRPWNRTQLTGECPFCSGRRRSIPRNVSGRRPDRRSTLFQRPVFPAGVRARLRRITDDPLAGPSRRKRALVLLLAGDARRAPQLDGLAESVGVSRQTCYLMLRDPKAAWTKLFHGTSHRPASDGISFNLADHAILKRFIKDPEAKDADKKRARVLLLIDGRQEPVHLSLLARAAGVSRPTLTAILKNPHAVLRELLEIALPVSHSDRD